MLDSMSLTKKDESVLRMLMIDVRNAIARILDRYTLFALLETNEPAVHSRS
jgi:hypothetical protein